MQGKYKQDCEYCGVQETDHLNHDEKYICDDCKEEMCSNCESAPREIDVAKGGSWCAGCYYIRKDYYE